MGLPVKRFIAANNRNDIFYQYLQTGKYNPRPSIATIANAMDVAIRVTLPAYLIYIAVHMLISLPRFQEQLIPMSKSAKR